jgi:hypothetical protein
MVGILSHALPERFLAGHKDAPYWNVIMYTKHEKIKR